MTTHRIGWIALAVTLLATTPHAQTFAAERFSVAQATSNDASNDEDWRRRQKRPDRPSRTDRGNILIFAPVILDALPDREIAPPEQFERPEARPRQTAKTRTSKPKSARQAVAKPRIAKAKSAAPKSRASIPAALAGTYVEGEVLFVAPSPELSDRALRRHRLTRLETTDLALTGTTIVRARVAKGRNALTTLRELRADKTLLSSELNHLYALQADSAGATSGDLASVQYAPAKMRLPEAHGVADGNTILVAVIDSGIDGSHPELAGTLDPASSTTTIGPHGTAIAGVIAAHQRLISASPKVRILAFDAFLGQQGSAARSSTLDILKSLDKAATAGARIVNLSFAGPEDRLLSSGLEAAGKRGMILIAAAGNDGPKAAPAYPAAHPAVIAVTATDPTDQIYADANRGAYIALAAPGVDILTTAPDANYSQFSGTSFAAAQVTGVAALLLERAPKLSPDRVRAILTETARDLGKPGRDDVFGAGLVDAAAALTAVSEATASAALQ